MPVWALIGAALAAIYAVFAMRLLDLGRDPAAYLGLAQSIAAGDGYVFNGRPHTQYPPGYPAILAGAVAIFGDEFAALSRFTAVFFAAGVFLVAIYARLRDGDKTWPLPAVMLLFSAPYFALATGGLKSEGPYIVASMALLAFMEWNARHTARIAGTVVAGVLLAATVAIRSAGMALVLAMAITAAGNFIRSRMGGGPRRASWMVPAGAVLLSLPYLAAWSRWSETQRRVLFQGEFFDAYAAQFRMRDPHLPDLGEATTLDILLRLPKGIVVHAAHAAEVFTNVSWIEPLWHSTPVLLLIVVTVAGVFRELRRDNPLMGWYVLLYVGMFAVWPFDEGPRFIIPVIPLLAMLAIAGARDILRGAAAGERVARGIILAVPALGVVGSIFHALRFGGLSTQGLLSFVLWAGSFLLAWRWTHSTGWTVPRRVRTAAVVAGASLFVLMGVRRHLVIAETRRNPGPYDRYASVRLAADWIRQNTPPDALLMAATDAGLHLATGRATMPFPVSRDPSRLRGAFERLRPDYLLVEDRKPFEYFSPTQGERLGIIRAADFVRLEEVARVPGTRLFRVHFGP